MIYISEEATSQPNKQINSVFSAYESSVANPECGVEGIREGAHLDWILKYE